MDKSSLGVVSSTPAQREVQNSHNILLKKGCLVKKKLFSEKKCGMVKKILVEKFYSFLIVFSQAIVIKSLYTPAEHFKCIMDRGTEKREEHGSLFLKKFP